MRCPSMSGTFAPCFSASAKNWFAISHNIRAPLKLSGMIFDFDSKDFLGKRKPFRLIIDRRINVPFSENIFYSQAPFRTDDHLDVLTQFERAALIK